MCIGILSSIRLLLWPQQKGTLTKDKGRFSIVLSGLIVLDMTCSNFAFMLKPVTIIYII